MVDLNTLLGSPSDLQLLFAYAVSDSGDILAYGTLPDGDVRIAVLTPDGDCDANFGARTAVSASHPTVAAKEDRRLPLTGRGQTEP